MVGGGKDREEMSKAVLVMDMPSSCSKCKLKSRLNCEIEGVTHCCNLAEGMITLDKGFEERLPNCPLRELPKKDNKSYFPDEYSDGHRDGYNACIDELLGEENGSNN